MRKIKNKILHLLQNMSIEIMICFCERLPHRIQMWARTFLKAFMLCKPWEYCYPYVKKDICNFFLVPNVLTVMQDIQKVKHIYFSFLEMHDISMFEGSRENELFCWWIALYVVPTSIWILNYCRWKTCLHFICIWKPLTYLSIFLQLQIPASVNKIYFT